MRTGKHFIVFSLSQALLSNAIDTHDKWSSVYNTSLYNDLPSCAQPCVAHIDTDLQCWSYGCVCSESTLGTNFMNATRYIETCVRDGCGGTANAALNPALNAFQSLCGVDYLDLNIAANATAPAVTVTTTAIPTATFDPAHAVIVDLPSDLYNKLDPCLRWVLNVGGGRGDNAENTHPRVPGDYSSTWLGLGVTTKCMNAQCLCSGPNYELTNQKLYDAADYLCQVGFPSQDNTTNPLFTDLVTFYAEYCSKEGGSILAEWVIALKGLARNTGMTQETKVAIGVGVVSCVLALGALIDRCIPRKKKNRSQNSTI